MNALANAEVGRYLNRHFVSAFQKVATFQINGKQKNGGNVAGYFCTPGGFVLHAIAGPVNADTFLREARWVNDTFNLAVQSNLTTAYQLRAVFRKAHLDRLNKEQHVHRSASQLPQLQTVSYRTLSQTLEQNSHRSLNNQGKVHLLLAVAPLPQIDQLYGVVFEKILNEKLSTIPVQVAGK